MKPAVIRGAIAGLLVFASVAVAQTQLGPGTYVVPPGTTVTADSTTTTLAGGGTVNVPYLTRCEELRQSLGAGLVACWDFERPEDALLQQVGKVGSVYRPGVTIDPTEAASGKSSLRFETISYNEAQRRHPDWTPEQLIERARQSNTSWWGRNFSPDWDVQFGLGDEFWLQMRMKDSESFYAGPWGGAGPKKWIMGAGDRYVEFKSELMEILPVTAGKGSVIRLWSGDSVANMSNYGTITVGDENIQYSTRDVANNTLMIFHRPNPKHHEAGTPTYQRYMAYAPGCSDLEIPVTSGWNYVPESYHSCGVKDRKYEGHELPLKTGTFTDDHIVQSGQRGTWNEEKKTWEGGCLLSRVKAGDYAGCLRDRPGDGWVTWTIHVKLSQPAWYANDRKYTHGSTLRIWRNDRLLTELSPDLKHPRAADSTDCGLLSPLSVVDARTCLSGYDFIRSRFTGFSHTGPLSLSDPGGKYGKIWINMQSWRRQYLTKDDPIMCCHPIITRHYDDLVVSRVPIPLPDGTVLN